MAVAGLPLHREDMFCALDTNSTKDVLRSDPKSPGMAVVPLARSPHEGSLWLAHGFEWAVVRSVAVAALRAVASQLAAAMPLAWNGRLPLPCLLAMEEAGLIDVPRVLTFRIYPTIGVGVPSI